jgi:medium-chain acyl-[acyl-carrier-protein] hydrolase
MFCFPYAGGRASFYTRWIDRLAGTVEVVPVEYPGRGRKHQDNLATSMPRLVESLLAELAPQMRKPFVFFGHSMGAFVAFEIAYELRRQGWALPELMIISGARAPHLKDADYPEGAATEMEFIKVLSRRGTTPLLPVLEDRELLDFVLPIVRADFTVCGFKPADRPPLEIPFAVFGGEQDPIAPDEQLQGWAVHTSHGFSLTSFPGGHFFIRESESLVLREVEREIWTRLMPIHPAIPR